MRLTSRAFTAGAEIPMKYTHDGADVSPPLAWSEVPPGTQSLALVVDDPDAPDPARTKRTWVHWLLVDLPPEITRLPEAVDYLPGGQVGFNDWHHSTWDGPAPPIGRHRCVFKLYALDCKLGLEHPSKLEVEQAMQGHVLAEARLVGTYKSAHA